MLGARSPALVGTTMLAKFMEHCMGITVVDVHPLLGLLGLLGLLALIYGPHPRVGRRSGPLGDCVHFSVIVDLK
jgi:hypothetical protein